VRLVYAAMLVLLLPIAGCDGGEGWIVLHNQIGSPITSVSIAPCGTQDPGPDQLAGAQIPAGGSESFRVRFGCHRVLALFPDGRFAEWSADVNRSSRRVELFTQVE
jgi:hypothetical protein